jgi:predicted Zn-dependent peptidase
MASHSDTGSLAVYAGTSQERLAEVIEIILREFKRLKKRTVGRIELDSAKEQLKGNILLSLESSDNRMSKLAKNEIYFGRYQSLQELMEGFDGVSVNSLQELSQQIFDDRNITLVLLGRPGGISFSEDRLTI